VASDRPDAQPPRRLRRGKIQVGVELGAVAVLAIGLLAVVGVVLGAGHEGAVPPPDTLVVSQTADFPFLDPALAQTREAWELEYATCGKLLDYPARGGFAGTRLLPDLAVAFPRISHDRRTYVFRVRRGRRFSDGTRVTAASFARALERARSPALLSPAAPYLREVTGWSAHGRTLTIRLRRAAPDFEQRLALPYFCAVPSDAPNEPRDDLPSAGPFAVARYERGHTLLLERNRYYTGPRRVRLRRIVYRFGAFASQIRLQLERGETDYGVVSAAAFESLATEFRGDRHLFVVRQPTVAYLALNTQRPLFEHNPRLRRAVAYAIDRSALARQFGTGGATATDQYLPPGTPGFRDAHLYPLRGPELDRARRLAAGHLRGRHATYLACGGADCTSRAQIVAANLAKIGLHVDVRTSPGLGPFTLAGVQGTKFDIADVITRPDYGDPYALVEKLLDGRSIRAAGNTNVSYFDDRQLNRAIDRAQRLEGAARFDAYGRLDVEVARREAPLVAYANLNARVFVSSRVGCVTYQPVYGLDLASVCLRESKRGSRGG
jgi:peptide/nickel transport system substrate-binding protein